MDELTGVEVIDNPERRRFEARKGRKVLGWASYEQTSELIVFTHTRVDRRWEGLGLGGNIEIIGTPEQVVEQLVALKAAGIDGVQLNFHDFALDLAHFGERILPLLKQAGLRL